MNGFQEFLSQNFVLTVKVIVGIKKIKKKLQRQIKMMQQKKEIQSTPEDSFENIAKRSICLSRKILYEWKVSWVTDLIFMVLFFMLGLWVGIDLK